MVKPYLNEIGGKVENDINMFTGGLNVYEDKAFIESNHMPYVMNMTMKNPPTLETRNSRASLVEDMDGEAYSTNPDITSPVIDIWTYNEFQFYTIVKAYDRVNIVQYKRTSRASKYVATPIATIEEEPNYYFTLARTGRKDYLYITGLTFKYKIDLTYDGNPEAEWRWRIQDGHYGICCCHKGRLFLASPDSNIITFSALGDFDNFDTPIQYQLVTNPLNMVDENYSYLMEDANNSAQWEVYTWNDLFGDFVLSGHIAKTELVIDVNTGLSLPDYSIIAGDFKVTNSKGKIVSLQSYDDKMIVFCEHTMHALYGDTPDITKQNQFQLVDLNNNLGAVAHRCITIGGGRLFFLGDDHEVYEYTGSSIQIVTRPGTTRNSTISVGGVSGLIKARDVDNFFDVSHSKFVATSERLYINIWNNKNSTIYEKLLFVFDIYNRLWWCEDGNFTTIGNYSDHENKILLARPNCDLLVNNYGKGNDKLYNFETDEVEDVPIEYEFHTRVFGADGLDMRKTLSEVWVQARAEATVYLNDIWSSLDAWARTSGFNNNLLKIGELKYESQLPTQETKYRPDTYEQQVCYVEKMYGQRLNAFQIVVKGSGVSKFWLMKRVWRTR